MPTARDAASWAIVRKVPKQVKRNDVYHRTNVSSDLHSTIDGPRTMKFPSPLVRGRLVKRYKRFLADIELDDGSTITTAVPNTGSMMGLSAPGTVVWLSLSTSVTRKYPHTWEMVENDMGDGPQLVGINTNHPNGLVTEAIQAKKIAQLEGYASLRREVKYGVNSRIDILLDDPAKGTAYLEIKNVHLMRTAGQAEFPDSVTERGVKHLEELSAMVKAGHRAVMMYLIQRKDAMAFSIAADIDPAYAKAFVRAKKSGVEALAYRCALSLDGIELDREIAIK
jgi:sugar fermentation stimulation protein A